MISKFAGAALAAVLSLVAPLAAGALIQRTFVASYGLDTNPCNLPNPCRTFNTAIGNTLPGGEVVILDTAGYGAMTINKSIKIVGPAGIYGGITVFGGVNPTTGIVINAGATDVVTLRGLDISGVPGAAPLPLYGIDIQNAGVVHIEKSSIGNFTQPTGACINFAPTAETYVHIDDSFLRECRTGINANGTAVPGPGGPAVIVDNTRIEFGRAASGPAYGLWVQGNMGVSVRNSLISLQDVSIQMDNLPTTGNMLLELSQTKLAGAQTGLNVVSATAGGVPFVYITGSQFVGIDDAIIISHTAAGTPSAAQLKVTDSVFEHLSNGGITVSTGADAGIGIDLVRSQVNFTTTAISVAAAGTSGIGLHIRDSTLSNATTLLKTSGTSAISATLIRSHLHNSITAVDHGRGKIRLEQTNITSNVNSLVNNGSGNIVSAGIGATNGTNWIVDNADSTGGTVYITPTIIQMK